MVIAFGFMAVMALKLVPVYLGNMTLQSIIESIEKNSNEYNSPAAIRTAIVKRMSVNNIEQVTGDDVMVELVNYNYEIDIDYEVRIPFVHNIDFVVTFVNHAEIRAR